MSLNILLSHSRSLKVIGNDTVEKGIIPISMSLCLYLAPFLRYSALNNGLTLKSGFLVVQGHRQWRSDGQKLIKLLLLARAKV